MVREALVTSVTCSPCCERFQTSQLSTVPKASLPWLARSRALAHCRVSSGSWWRRNTNRSASRFFPHDGFEAAAFQFIAEIGRAAVLPDDGVVHRAARLAVPDDGRFALVGDADGGDRCAIQSRVRDGFGGDAGLRRPDILWVMFDPTWLRIYLREFLLCTETMLPARSNNTARELVVP